MTEHTKGPLTLRFNRPTEAQRKLIYEADACGWGDMFAERDAAVSKLTALQAENKRNYDKWWDYEQQYILPCFKWAKECGIDLPALVMEGKGNSTIRFFEALRDRLSELERHNTEHHCGVGEIAKQRDAALIQLVKAREALELIKQKAAECRCLDAAGIAKSTLDEIEDPFQSCHRVPEQTPRPHEHDFGGAGQYRHCRTCGLTQEQARAANRPEETKP